MKNIVGKLSEKEIKERIGNYKGTFTEFDKEEQYRKGVRYDKPSLFRFRDNRNSRNTATPAMGN